MSEVTTMNKENISVRFREDSNGCFVIQVGIVKEYYVPYTMNIVKAKKVEWRDATSYDVKKLGYKVKKGKTND